MFFFIGPQCQRESPRMGIRSKAKGLLLRALGMNFIA